MTLYQLGEEYVKQADDLKSVIAGYSVRRSKVNGIELYELNRDLTILREMERDTRIIGKQLMEYYSQQTPRKVYHSHKCN